MKKNMIVRSPRISAAAHPSVVSALQDPVVEKMVREHDSGSINIVFPDIAVENVRQFVRVGEELHVPLTVAVAHKPNKSQTIVREIAAQTQAHIDVASLGELHSAQRAGFSAGRICAGGPKNTAFLIACVTQGITISIDSVSELLRIIDICTKSDLSQKISVFVRVNVESILNEETESRFGILFEEVDRVISILSSNQSRLQFLGFACHINADAKKKRSAVFARLLDLTYQAMRMGLSPTHVNMGGGFRVNYVGSSIANLGQCYFCSLDNCL